MSRLRGIIAVGLGAVGAGVFYYSNDNTRVIQAAQKFHDAPFATSKIHDEAFPITKWDSNWDRRDPAYLVKPSKGGDDDIRYKRDLEEIKSKATRNIILIRHGQFNLSGKHDLDKYLTEKGVEQAKMTGDRLVALNHPYTRMVRSTMTRAQQTGDHILSRMKKIDNLVIENDSMLEEGAPFPPEPPRKNWEPVAYTFFQDGSRIEAAFRNYIYRADQKQKEDSYEIIVCHANVIRYFVCRALQLPPEAWLRINLHHASMSWLRIRPNGRVGLLTMGNCGHLPPDMLTLE